MRTVSFATVLQRACQAVGLKYAELSTEDFLVWRDALSDALRDGWRVERWPELCDRGWVRVRPLFSLTDTYDPGDEVFDPATNAFYLALIAGLGNALTDLSIWAVAKSSYGAATVVAATAYAVGDQAYDPVTDKSWQCMAGTTGATIGNAAFWGELVEFVPSITTDGTAMDEVLWVFDGDPRVNVATKLSFEVAGDGILVPEGYGKVWAFWRKAPPTLTGANWDATTIYAAGTQVYFYGDFYTAAAVTAAGESPVSVSAKWVLVEIPMVLLRWLVKTAASEWLETDGKLDEAALKLRGAALALGAEADVLHRQQGQTARITVLTR